jgi:hypothetical protein
MKKIKCPPIHYTNCSNAQRRCWECVAGFGSKDLYYEPIASIGNHPLSNWQQDKEEKRAVVRRAKQTETHLQRSIATKTLRSGAACGDGDLLLLGEIRQEVKRRGTRSSWNLTLKEYEKGLQQGIQVWSIEIQHPETGKPIVVDCIQHDLFLELIAQLHKTNDQNHHP